MNNLPIINQPEQTTVNVDELKAYLLARPRYQECGKAVGVSSLAASLLARTDCVEFALRQYIGGQTKTLRDVNQEIRRFIAFDERSASAMIDFSLRAVQTTLLDYEAYELMSRYVTARKRIYATFSI